VNRRSFISTIAVPLLAAPLAVEAQQAGKVYRIGYLAQGDRSHPAERNLLAGFQQGLGELGYVEGHNLVIEYRWAEMNVDRLPVLATELVQLRVDLIASVATRASLAAKHATQTVPIVMTVSLHAVESGLVESLAHPGANITGMTGLSDETIAKRLGLLKEVVVTLVRVAVLWNPEFYNRAHEPQWRAIEAAAVRLGVTLESVEVRRFDDFDGAFAGMTRSRVGGVIVFPDLLTVKHRQRIAELATRYRLPTAYQDRESVEVGGLLSYGLSFFESAAAPPISSTRSSKAPSPPISPSSNPPSSSWSSTSRRPRPSG
jgi:ABC-type uncharacterized transport system substrate-binding protein